jgi:hypothetical protein
MVIINSGIVVSEVEKLIISNMKIVEGLGEVFTGEQLVKQRRVTETSIMSHRQLVNSGQKKKQADIILYIIKQHQPITARMAWNKSNMEQSSVKRCFTDLRDLGLIKVVYNEKCKETGIAVGYYALIEWEKEQPDTNAKEEVYNA